MPITFSIFPYLPLTFPPFTTFQASSQVIYKGSSATFATNADTDTTIAMKYTTNTVTFYLQQHFILQLFARVFVQSIYSPFTVQAEPTTFGRHRNVFMAVRQAGDAIIQDVALVVVGVQALFVEQTV